jgi:hypothetical protein
MTASRRRIRIAVPLIADGGERRQAEGGELTVLRTRFDRAALRVRVAELRVSATVTRAGEARHLSSSWDAGRALPSTRVRIAR